MAITAQLVKELREITGAGMMDCKKALTATDGDIDKAVDWLRENGVVKAAKKADRIAAEGLTRAATQGDLGVVFEINSETDFVAKNEQFLALFDKVEGVLLNGKPSDVESALDLELEGIRLEEALINATATIGEKITLRRFEVVEKNADEVFGAYIHMGGKISALVTLKGGNEEVARDIAMQVASMSPTYVDRAAMPKEVVDHERSIQEEILKKDESLAGKPEKVLAGIIEGRISKNLKDMCLVEQEFFKNPDQKVSQYLKESGAEVVSFVRYMVGEGIEKKEDNFAEEVMNQAFGK